MRIMLTFFAVVTGLSVAMINTTFGQYLPPTVNDYNQSATPDYSFSGAGGQVKYLQMDQNRNQQPIPQNYAQQFPYPTPSHPVVLPHAVPQMHMFSQYGNQPQPRTEVSIIFTPVAAPVDTAQITPPPVQKLPATQAPSFQQPGMGQTGDAENQQQAPAGMTAQTIYYFPPPTFPDPIPLTIYRAADPQPQQEQQQQQGQGMGQFSPYAQMQNQMNGGQMYMQPQYPAPQQTKGGLFSKKSKTLSDPGQPTVAPPTLVYPNGIVVRPKVYVPGQPFKNVVRGVTP